MQKNICLRKGFTLVELSIVLVIIGLLVGGVLAGQSLIKGAQLKSVMREAQAYQTAVGAFKDKYFAIPGDMANATSYWGALHSDPNTCKTMSSTTTATCNGDGNGMVGSSTSADWREPLRAFQHLANAGLVAGSYNAAVSGLASPNNIMAAGVNIPASKYSPATWSLYGMGNTYTGYFPTVNYGNIFFFGKPRVNDFNTSPAVIPEDAYNIDMKMDDGKPYTGTIVTALYGAYGETGCVTSDGSSYVLTDQTPSCLMVFVTGW